MTLNKHGFLSTGYQGSISITVSGLKCKNWSDTPYARTMSENKNYCRSPDNDPVGAWCYATNQDIRWDYCSFHETLSGNVYFTVFVNVN